MSDSDDVQDNLIHGLRITEIPGPLHAENWNHVGGGPADNTLSNLRHAHGQLLPTLADIVHTHRDVMKDPLQTEARNLQQAFGYATKRASVARDTMERAMCRTLEVINKLDESTTQVPNAGPSENMRLYSDRLYNMSPEERRDRIVQAIQEDDRGTLAAVFGVSGWANGLSMPELDHFRDLYRRTKYPDLLERRETLARGVDLSQRAIRAFDQHIEKMYDRKRLADAQAASEAAQRRLSGGGGV